MIKAEESKASGESLGMTTHRTQKGPETKSKWKFYQYDNNVIPKRVQLISEKKLFTYLETTS